MTHVDNDGRWKPPPIDWKALLEKCKDTALGRANAENFAHKGCWTPDCPCPCPTCTK